MKVAGIVCEYNPMHNGHLLHLEKTREAGATHIVCAMSGDFVQRGECAFIDKRARAEAAVRCGADLVAELPVPWSCAAAPDFAFGAVSILDSLGIDLLSFGAETDDAGLLLRCAEAVRDAKVGELTKDALASGMSYPAALCRAIGTVFGEKEAAIAASPNSTLALEYVGALKKLCSSAQILAVKRFGASHDENAEHGSFSSASYIRSLENLHDASGLMPLFAFEKLLEQQNGGLAPCRIQNAERAILAVLRKMTLEEFSFFADDGRGLAQRLFASVKTARSLDELYFSVKTKNITMARVRRAVLSAFLGIAPGLSAQKPEYVRVLAANERGFEILSRAPKKLPIVTKHSDFKALSQKARDQYALVCHCSDLFSLFSPQIMPCSREQTGQIAIVR